MARTIILTLVLFCVYISSGHKTLPPGMPLCRRSDPNLNSCLRDAIQNSITFLKNGIPELNMPPVDPLHLHETNIQQTNNGPVHISLLLTHSDLYGLSEATVSSVDVDWDNYRIKVNLKIKDLYMVGDYEVDGNVLTMPLVGKGKFNFTFEGGEGHIQLFGKNVERNGYQYMDVDKISWDYNPEKMIINLENLFNDKEKSEKINAFLNEQWQILDAELKTTVQETYSDSFKEFSSILFREVPLEFIAPA